MPTVNVLAVGAHPDDVELGCGATLAAHRAHGDELALLVMTSGEQGPQAARSRMHEQEEAAQILGATLLWGGFEDGGVPHDRKAIDFIDAIVRDTGADTVYTHSPNDTHQDHRATALASLAAVRRSRRVLLYESPTTTTFAPSLYVEVSDHLDTKMAALRAHLSQVLKNGLVDLEAVEAQARYRGFTARMRCAEGFEAARFAWDLSARRSDDADTGAGRAAFMPTSI